MKNLLKRIINVLLEKHEEIVNFLCPKNLWFLRRTKSKSPPYFLFLEKRNKKSGLPLVLRTYSLLRRNLLSWKFNSSPFFCYAKNRLADYGSVLADAYNTPKTKFLADFLDFLCVIYAWFTLSDVLLKMRTNLGLSEVRKIWNVLYMTNSEFWNLLYHKNCRLRMRGNCLRF